MLSAAIFSLTFCALLSVVACTFPFTEWLDLHFTPNPQIFWGSPFTPEPIPVTRMEMVPKHLSPIELANALSGHHADRSYDHYKLSNDIHTIARQMIYVDHNALIAQLHLVVQQVNVRLRMDNAPWFLFDSEVDGIASGASTWLVHLALERNMFVRAPHRIMRGFDDDTLSDDDEALAKWHEEF